MVVTAGLRIKTRLRRGWVGKGLIVAVQRLASEEGCASLVVRNFDRGSAASERLQREG